MLYIHYFSSCLFVLTYYHIAKEIKSFRSVEWFSFIYFTRLVRDVAKRNIKYQFKFISNLTFTCWFTFIIQHFLT